jgi:hypothetical protein
MKDIPQWKRGLVRSSFGFVRGAISESEKAQEGKHLVKL